MTVAEVDSRSSQLSLLFDSSISLIISVTVKDICGEWSFC